MWGIILEFIGYFLLGGGIGSAVSLVIAGLIQLFSNKKTLLTGPIGSGKTTFLNYLLKEKIEPGPSGKPTTYKVDNAVFDEATDFGGADAWLEGVFDEYIKSHDYILFFFAISEYLKDNEYRLDTNARLDMINKTITSAQTVLLVGTHKDESPSDYQSRIENLMAGKPYQNLLNRIVYIDTRQKECVDIIYKNLK